MNSRLFDRCRTVSARQRTWAVALLAAVVTLVSMGRVLADDDDDKKTDLRLLPTHKQTHIIRPKIGDQPVNLNTFCLDPAGNILACVGGSEVEYVENEDGTFETKKTEKASALQVYSPEGELVRQIDLTFKATAVSVAPDGTVFLAGSGKLAKLTAEGEIIEVVDSPWLGDMEALKKEAEEDAKAQLSEMTESMASTIERIENRIAKIEAKPEEDRTEREVKRLETLREQLTAQQEQAKQMEAAYSQMFDVESMLENRTRVTSLAVNSKDVFVCAGGKGYGYEVWRLDHAFANPERVVESLSGCCGQCDIQATDEHLVIAANTKFTVDLLDRDGKEVRSFGERGGDEGFGSCCNPMNVRCCDNGDILTAESSIGWIKRFDKDGKLVATIGKAKIGGGCKHVPIGFDAKLDRYYMMYEDKSEICVLVPKSEAPEFTAEELAAKEARAGLGQKLIGAWVADAAAAPADGEGGMPMVMIAGATADEADSTETSDDSGADTTKPAGDQEESSNAAGGDGEPAVMSIPAFSLIPAEPTGDQEEASDTAGGDGVTAVKSIPAFSLIPAEPAQDPDTARAESPDQSDVSDTPEASEPAGESADAAAEAETAILDQFAAMSLIPNRLEFLADGTLKAEGSFLAGAGSEWAAVRQDGDTIVVSQFQDDVSNFDMEIKFVSDDEIHLTMLMGMQNAGEATFRRVKDEPASGVEESNVDDGNDATQAESTNKDG
jgi:hypothetical protein